MKHTLTRRGSILPGQRFGRLTVIEQRRNQRSRVPKRAPA
jgi:hypothetical protein